MIEVPASSSVTICLKSAARRLSSVPGTIMWCRRDGIETYALLGSQNRRLVVLERSFHAVTRDVERETVFAEVGRFCRSVAPQVDRMADAAGTHG